MKEYFVCRYDVSELELNLNALIDQGYAIEQIFHTGTWQDMPQFTVIAVRAKP